MKIFFTHRRVDLSAIISNSHTMAAKKRKAVKKTAKKAVKKAVKKVAKKRKAAKRK